VDMNNEHGFVFVRFRIQEIIGSSYPARANWHGFFQGENRNNSPTPRMTGQFRC